MSFLFRRGAPPPPPFLSVPVRVPRPALRPTWEIDRWTGRPVMRWVLAPVPVRPRPEEVPHGRGT